MKNKALNQLRQKIEKGQFPNKYKEFGGADLIITSDKNRKHEEHITMVYTEHAAAMSWLVFQLKEIYDNDLNWRNKYDFYPVIGKLVNDSLTSQDKLFDSMLFVIDVIEETWG